MEGRMEGGVDSFAKKLLKSTKLVGIKSTQFFLILIWNILKMIKECLFICENILI